jgi:hypothetical protein
MPHISVPDKPRDISHEFDATFLDDATSRDSGQELPLRWFEVSMYRMDPPSTGFLAMRVSMSNIYHRPDTRCVTRTGEQKGSPATVDDLPAEAVPCPVCRPAFPLDLGDEEVIRFEFPRYTFDRGNAKDVLAKLVEVRRRGSAGTTTFMSEPVATLLGKLRTHVPEFAELGRTKQTIT